VLLHLCAVSTVILLVRDNAGKSASADSGQYDVPQVSTLAGPRAFPIAGPLAWNQLPASLRSMNCIATFNRHLKTILFKAAYGVADN